MPSKQPESQDHQSDRLDKIEKMIDGLDKRLDQLETKVENHGSAIGRITSHIESEVGLARSDLGRIESKLFGKDEDTNGGKIGDINRRIYQMEKWFFAMIAAAGIVIFMIAAYSFILKLAGNK